MRAVPARADSGEGVTSIPHDAAMLAEWAALTPEARTQEYARASGFDLLLAAVAPAFWPPDIHALASPEECRTLDMLTEMAEYAKAELNIRLAVRPAPRVRVDLPLVTPTVGRIVHFFVQYVQDVKPEAHAALVTAVSETSCAMCGGHNIALTSFTPGGNTVAVRDVCWSLKPEAGCWSWPAREGGG